MEREAQFRSVVDACGSALSRMLAGWERDVEKRAELKQEVLVALWSALPRFRGESSPRTFALRVAHNVAMRHVSKQVADCSEPFETLEHLEAELVQAEDQLDRHRQRQALMHAINRLVPRDRQLALLWLEGVPSAEVAQITGLSRTYVNTRNQRIRLELTRRLRRAA